MLGVEQFVASPDTDDTVYFEAHAARSIVAVEASCVSARVRPGAWSRSMCSVVP